jgi:penicillin-binding protein 1A
MFKELATIFGVLLICAFAGVGGVLFVLQHYGKSLPDYLQLADYEPPVMTRVHAGDGRLMAEYATEKRVFVPMRAMPRRVINAFLAAEDKNFYSHRGIDFTSVLRAVLVNIKNIGRGRRPVGASTITQQVAKNFLLTNEVSWERKVKEAILSFRMERAFTKDRILELYLNEIYLGFRSYGVAAAALNYFNKSLDELSIAEVGFLGALPKAPNNYNPLKHPNAARVRRNWVIGQMAKDGSITADEATEAKAEPLVLENRSETEFVQAGFFSEEVRRELQQRYGKEGLYKGGLSVRTTLDPRLQEIADRALRRGLVAYDRRHGWRGAVSKIAVLDNWPQQLAALKAPKGSKNWSLAVVLNLDAAVVDIGLVGGAQGRIPFAEMKWARPWIEGQKVGPRPKKPANVLATGDIILVEKVLKTAKGKEYPEGSFGLRQMPDIEGALVALDPHTGRVLAMTGGYSHEISKFNRVTQAKRQPGSAFKPFVYLAALDAGYTPATLILDAPFVIDQGPGLPKWRPGNYTKKFYGPSTMRLGIEKSRNLMTVRLAQTVGMVKIADYAKRMGIIDKMPQSLAMSLGAGETTLLRITAAYGMLVNGGVKITPTLIDRIQDRQGRTVFQHDQRRCRPCRQVSWTQQDVPKVPDIRERVANPSSAYQMTSMLQGVVERGTGRRIKQIGKPLAGKTGTTNDSRDAWFIGFSPDLALGVYTGFDNPKSLGKREQGASVAIPIFKDFMAEALEGKPAIPFRIPPGIRLVRVNSKTGQLAAPGERAVILEAFKPGTVPVAGRVQVLEGVTANPESGIPSTGTGGLY